MPSLLIVSIAYTPNVGGVETHLSDLVSALIQKKKKVIVLTYQPVTNNKRAKYIENSPNLTIIRLPFVSGLFYNLVHHPALEFIYLTPLLFFALPAVLIFNPSIKTIHSHGLIAGFVSVVWGKVFGRRVITTTHSIYTFPDKGIYRLFAKTIFDMSDKVLCLSKQSVQEINDLGIPKTKIKKFTYWVDLKRFRPGESKRRPFTVLFVGRLVVEKGVLVLVDAIRLVNQKIQVQIAGSGPVENQIPKKMRLGTLSQDQLPKYYARASLVIVPSIHEEGFGRVILEALACGTVVLGSHRGAIPEAINDSVGELFEVSPKNIAHKVNYYYLHPKVLKNKSHAARQFALDRYSAKNVQTIIETYDH